MKALRKRLNKGHIARLKKDLLLLLSHLERLEPRRKENLHVRNMGSEFASLEFLLSEGN